MFRLSFKVECVAGEWWCYSYDGAMNGIALPSLHKTARAAKKAAVKYAFRWIEAGRKEVLA